MGKNIYIYILLNITKLVQVPLLHDAIHFCNNAWNIIHGNLLKIDPTFKSQKSSGFFQSDKYLPCLFLQRKVKLQLLVIQNACEIQFFLFKQTLTFNLMFHYLIVFSQFVQSQLYMNFPLAQAWKIFSGKLYLSISWDRSKMLRTKSLGASRKNIQLKCLILLRIEKT